MNDQMKSGQDSAREFYKATRIIEEATEALLPFAKQQSEIMKRVLSQLGLKDNNRELFYYDWIELQIGGYYEGTSDVPVILCQLCGSGRGGDSDRNVGEFKLSRHILNNDPETFEAEFRAKYAFDADRKKEREVLQRQNEIAALQEKLAKLQKEQQ